MRQNENRPNKHKHCRRPIHGSLVLCAQRKGLAKLPQDSSALELQIVDARTGNGISGARIDADYFLGLQTSSKAVTSDAKGICVLDPPLVSWTRVRILVTAEEHVPQSIIWERADIPAMHRIKLESGRTVGGMVLNEAGQPVPNAQYL